VVLVDDSIVRGNTISFLVRMLWKCGATAVHVRISSPPILHPCFMGIDFATKEQLVAYNKTVDDICKEIGATSLMYLSHEGMLKAVKEGQPQEKAGYCGACFTGKYPLELDDW